MFTDDHLNPRAVNYQPLTPLGLLNRTITVHPKRPAIVWRDLTLNYAEFGLVIRRMMAWLIEQGITKGDVVSVKLNNRPELLAAHFAVPAVGGVLNCLNIRATQQDITYMLEHSGARLLITEIGQSDKESPYSIHEETVCSSFDKDDGINFFKRDSASPDLNATIEDEFAAIALNYTSGTTGNPKGVVYTHRGAYLNAIANVLALGFDQNTRYLWTLPMFHCNGWAHTWAVTAAGGTHICVDRIDPEDVIALLSDQNVTHLCCAPVVLYMIAEHMKVPTNRRIKVGTGGASPTPTLLSKLETLGFELVHLYGLTESYGPATLNDISGQSYETTTDQANDLARQGYAHMMLGDVDILSDDYQPVPSDGQTMGEIVLRGNTVMAGYFKDAAATEAAFAGEYFHTGDLAVRHPDGQIQIQDRAKDIIISGGENFSSLEVEKTLHEHPAILLAAVVAAPHEKWGEVGAAFIELRPNATVKAEELDAFCRDRLAGFKRPQHYRFGELPKTATGKIQKYELRVRTRAGSF